MNDQNESRKRIGGLLAMIGGLGYFGLLLIHGNLPDETTEIALKHIAARPEWRFMKLGLIVCGLCWVYSFEAFHQSMENPISKLTSRFAVICGSIGIAVVVVEYSIIGHALKGVADSWISNQESEEQLMLGSVMLQISSGLFYSFIAWMVGLPFLLMGIAVTISKKYFQWFGWIAIVCGTGALIGGVTKFVGLSLIPFPILYGAFIIPLTLWLTALGALMFSQIAFSKSKRELNGSSG